MKPISICPKLLAPIAIVKKTILSVFLLLFANLTFAQPTISGFSPVSGPPGTPVTITGTGFNTTPANNIVWFGTVKATVTAASANSLTVTVQANAGYQPFSVAVNNLMAYSAKPFTVLKPGMTPLDIESLSTTKGAANFSYNTSKNAMAAIDLNADGKPELVATQDFSKLLNMFTNTSTSTDIGFRNPVIPYDMGVEMNDVIAGDFNGDGIPEVVVASERDEQLNIYDNGLSNVYNAGIYGGARSVAIADIDGDGKTDIIVGCDRYSYVTILRNTSTGGALSFSKQNISVARPMKKLTAQDMDGDGKPDICGIIPESNSLCILQNTYTSGTLTFVTFTLPIDVTPLHIKVSDLDGNDRPDIAITHATSNTLAIYRNTSSPGSISLDAKIDYATNDKPSGIAIGDIDGDTKPEIALVDEANRKLQVLKNNSTSGVIDFTSINYTTDLRGGCIVINDFNGDGKADVAIGSRSDNTVQVLRNIIGEPEVTSFTPTEGLPPTTVTITGKNFNNVTSVVIGNRTAVFVVNSPTSITATVDPTAIDGFVTVTTPFGTASGLNLFNVLTPPTITSFSPNNGTRNTSVTIVGTNFFSGTEVTIGGVKATVTWTRPDNGAMTVNVGAGATGNIVVKTSDGTASKGTFTYYDAPTITSFSPTSAHFGDTVTIIGNNFNSLSQVVFSGYVAIYKIAESNTVIKAVVGGGTGITGDLIVKTVGGQVSLPGFTWLPPAPLITSFTPTTGISGSIITITGDNFTGVTDVQFGGVTAQFNVVNATTIMALLTTGATGDVTVTGPGGTVAAPGFTFISLVPTITGISPSSATTGETVTITGTNFVNTSAVNFGGTAPTTFAIVSNTQITAVVGTGTTGNVSITTPHGTANIPGFTYLLPKPTITGISPASATTGETVTITGTNFDNTTTVNFGGTAATSFNVVSPTEITAVVGAGNTGNISVTTPGGTVNMSGFTYVLPKPTIVGFAPARATKGNTITITGTNFTNASAVSLGGTALISFTVVSPTIITGIVGEGSSGNVSVTTPGGTVSLGTFTWSQPPVVIDEPPTTEPEPTTELTIYPNPTQSRTLFWVKHPVKTNDTWIRVVDLMGRTVATVRVPAGSSITPVSTEMLKAGYYHVGMHGAMLHKYKTLMVQ